MKRLWGLTAVLAMSLLQADRPSQQNRLEVELAVRFSESMTQLQRNGVLVGIDLASSKNPIYNFTVHDTATVHSRTPVKNSRLIHEKGTTLLYVKAGDYGKTTITDSSACGITEKSVVLIGEYSKGNLFVSVNSYVPTSEYTSIILQHEEAHRRASHTQATTLMSATVKFNEPATYKSYSPATLDQLLKPTHTHARPLWAPVPLPVPNKQCLSPPRSQSLTLLNAGNKAYFAGSSTQAHSLYTAALRRATTAALQNEILASLHFLDDPTGQPH